MQVMPEYRRNLVRELRRRQTESEILLWEALRNRKLGGYKFRRQRPLGRYVADFCCDAVCLVVEIDGGIHEESEQQEYDRVRDEELAAHGYRLLRLSVDAVLYRLTETLETICQAADTLSFPYPRPPWGEGREERAG